jgi:hypothetical protein
MKTVLRSGLLLCLAASAPAAALTLSTVPAPVIEGTPFILAVGLDASCPVPTSVTTPTFPGTIQVTLSEGCTAPPGPRLVEVPLGPLIVGTWFVHVALGGSEAELPLLVQTQPYRLALETPGPQAGSPFNLHFSGSASCPGIAEAIRDGYLLTIPFNGSCHILDPPPGAFDFSLAIDPLPAGDYVAQVVPDGGTSPLASLRFHVFGGAECIPSDTALCLQGGRFRVEAAWRTATAQGVGTARPETADSGSFWFFSPNNLELLVKVLDACRSDTPKYWVFAAGLTNVEVELTVTDTATGAERRYRSTRGVPFAPILDTAAFNCPVTG